MSDKSKQVLAWVLGSLVIGGLGYGGYYFIKKEGWLNGLGSAPAGTPTGGAGSGGTTLPQETPKCTDPNASNKGGALPCVCNPGFAIKNGICVANQSAASPQEAVNNALKESLSIISNSGVSDAQKIGLKQATIMKGYPADSITYLSTLPNSDSHTIIFNDALAKGIDLTPYVLAKAILSYKTIYNNAIDLNAFFGFPNTALHTSVVAAMAKLNASNYNGKALASRLHRKTFQASVLFGHPVKM